MISNLVRSIAFAAVLLTVSAGADAKQPGIVGTSEVEQALERGAIIWDVRAEEDYRRGHIPGAINIDDILAQFREPKSEDYLPVSQLERLLAENGIDPRREIILYGPKAAVSAYFGMITLQWLGGTNVSVYHGGLDDWKAAGKSLSTEAAKLETVSLSLSPRDDLLFSTAQVVQRVGRPDVQIVDARTSREFSGDDIRALRGGHIPGAINIPYETNWVDPETPRKLARKQVANKDGMNLKPTEQLKDLYAGLDPEKETIVYCQSGVRASNTAAVLQSLGFANVKVYDSSWLGYGNTLDAPAESVSYFNVARVNNLLNALQSRIEDLESQISELKTSHKK